MRCVDGAPTVRGFAHHHTDEELRADAWRFTADVLPPARREVWMRMRRGET